MTQATDTAYTAYKRILEVAGTDRDNVLADSTNSFDSKLQNAVDEHRERSTRAWYEFHEAVKEAWENYISTIDSEYELVSLPVEQKASTNRKVKGL